MKNLKNLSSGVTQKSSGFNNFLFYLYDYNQYRNLTDQVYSESWELRNQKYAVDQAEINQNIKHFVEQQNWNLETVGNNSSLNRVLQFQSPTHLNYFVNKAKSEINEMDHHPHLNIIDSTRLSVSLTTHDLGNVVGPKDYLLAAKLTNLYNDRSFIYFKNRRILSSLSGLLLYLVGFSALIFFVDMKYRYQITSRDFILSDITGFRKSFYNRSYSEESLKKGFIAKL